MKAPERKKRIDHYLDNICSEIYYYVHERGMRSVDGWVSSVSIQKELGLRHHCSPKGSCSDIPKNYMFNVAMRRLQDRDRVEVNKHGSRVVYRVTENR